ncbi:hypothetical protein niasHT_004640 [Heterodera trifolii]|uniref:Major facilitator superfamily (MFS) profile domain-containing protein n=1 Tax=Heterodera trifolii TaxID=157864 RepID=A0ABD2M7G7_9BILA
MSVDRPLCRSSVPATHWPFAAPSPPSRPRQFPSSASLNSSGTTAEALTVLERSCAKLIRAEDGFTNSAKNRANGARENSSIREPLLINGSPNNHKPTHWSTCNRLQNKLKRVNMGSERSPTNCSAIDDSSQSVMDESEILPENTQINVSERSLYVASFLSFCTVVQYSLYFASMWPYFKALDSEADEGFSTHIVAAYSLGQLLGSPLFGLVSNRMRKIRYVLYVGLLLMFFGNALYLSVHFCQEERQRKYWLWAARFVTGIGSGNISLLKAYASTASVPENRSRAIALITGGVALGQTIGPALQFLFTPFGSPGSDLPFGLQLSKYTAPAFMACIMNVVNAWCIKTMFVENYVGVHSSESERKQKSNTNNEKITSKKPKLPPYDKRAALLCYGTRFTQMFVNSNFEAIGSPLAMMMFAWTSDQVLIYISLAQGIMSLLAFLTYLVFIVTKIDKVVNDRANLLASLYVLLMFFLITYSYPFLPGNVETFHRQNLSNHSEPVGCNADKFDWCYTVRPLSPIYYYICYIFCIGLAFPNINISLNTLFSKIIGPRRQGTQQGILQMSGAFARALGPITIGTLYTVYGPQGIWIIALSVIFTTLLLWMLFFPLMVPLSLPEENERQNPTEKATDRPPYREERTPLVEQSDGRGEDAEAAENGNDATVTTTASLR